MTTWLIVLFVSRDFAALHSLVYLIRALFSYANSDGEIAQIVILPILQQLTTQTIVLFFDMAHFQGLTISYIFEPPKKGLSENEG